MYKHIMFLILITSFLLTSTASAQDNKELIFSPLYPSLKARADYLATRDWQCGKLKASIARLCVPNSFTDGRLRNTDDAISEGRILLSLESTSKKLATTCKLKHEEVWTPKCAQSKTNLQAAWKSQVDTDVNSNGQTMLMLLKTYKKGKKMKAGLRLTRTMLGQAFNWETFNQQLGIKHPNHTKYVKQLSGFSKFFEAHEKKRIANNRCPKAKYKNKKHMKQVRASANAYWSEMGTRNQKYSIGKITFSRKPRNNDPANDGSQRSDISGDICIKIVYPHMTRCKHYSFDAKREKYPNTKKWEAWRFGAYKYRDDVPCKTIK